MAAAVEKELFAARSYRRTPSGYEANRRYLIEGATNEQDATTASGLPTWGSVYGAAAPASNMKVREISATPHEESAGKFYVDVSWSWTFERYDEEPEDGTEIWELDGVGEMVHVDSCLSQTKYGTDAIDHDVAVGVDNDTVHGADIFDPAVTLTVRLFKTTTAVTQAYLAGCVQAFKRSIAEHGMGLQREKLYSIASALPRAKTY